MKRIRSHRGVEVHEITTGERVLFVRIESGGRSYLVRYGSEPTDAKGQGRAHAGARKQLERLREEARRARLVGENWVPPHAKRREQRKEAAAALDARTVLVFETAAARFLDQCAHEYARPDAVRAMFAGPLAAAFKGQHLDTITRTEIRQYYLDRMQNEGPFTGRTRQVSQRVPETEIAALSALYTFVADEGHAIENPCHRPRTRRKDSPLASYMPAHKAQLPSPAAMRALLSTPVRAEIGPRSKNRNGRELVGPAMRALVALTYYTAARPESEPCRLTHGDVVLADGETWGSVTYRKTKTGGDRRVLLHPEADGYLRAVMEPVPMDRSERERWAARPIFRRAGSDKPWNQGSYTKSWAALCGTVAGQHPEVAGLWLRDLRPTAKTRMVDAGVPTETTKAILGHRGEVADGYYRLSDDAMRRALMALSLREAEPCIFQAATRVGA